MLYFSTPNKSGTICGQAEEVAWWMEPLGSFPRVLNVLPRDKIEGPRGSTLSTQETSRGIHSPWYLKDFPSDFHSFYLTHLYITWKVKNKLTNYIPMEP